MILIANFKSYKTTEEVLAWIKAVGEELVKDQTDDQIIVCPQLPSLAQAKWLIEQSGYKDRIQLGSQNLSGFGEGAFTGEVSALALSPIVKYTIVGHSERRRLLHESTVDVINKIDQANHFGITPIHCVADDNLDEIAKTIGKETIVAYEPPDAISGVSGGKIADTAKIQQAISKIKQTNEHATVVYGGSVAAEYMAELMEIPGLSGFLIGKAGLDPDMFLAIIYAIRKSRQTTGSSSSSE